MERRWGGSKIIEKFRGCFRNTARILRKEKSGEDTRDFGDEDMRINVQSSSYQRGSNGIKLGVDREWKSIFEMEA